MKLRHSARTDVGRTRDHNEDDFGVGEGAQIEDYGHLFVVCDGMGGHAAGEVASRLGVETIIASYYESTAEDRAQAIIQAFERANARIHAEGHGTMGTTGVAALIYGDALLVANVGDSRAYLIRAGQIRQISRDHSLVSDQIAAGLITADQARSIHYRNVITRALGYQPEVVVDTFRWPLDPGDLVVLCSDGLHGLVTDDELLQTLIEHPLANAVERLVDLANERGGTDNITLLSVVIDALDWDEGPDTPEPVGSDSPTVPMTALAPPVPDIPEPAAPTPEPAPAPVTPAPRRVERRLSAGSLLLALLLLVVLVGAFWLAPSLAPAIPAITPGVTATAIPAATPAATPTTAP